MPVAGIRVRGRKSTPGRYFQVAEPGTSWGGTDIEDPLSILGPFDPKFARPGLTLLMVSTTGEQSAYFTLDEDLRPVATPLTAPLKAVVERIEENCEPAVASVLFMGGAGGSLRAGVTENPVALTRSVQRLLIIRAKPWPAPLEPWLPRRERRSARLPAVEPSCPPQHLTRVAPLAIVGVRDGDRLRRPAGSAEPLRLSLSTLGGNGRRWWFLDGRPIGESGAEARFSHSFRHAGHYQLSVLDEGGQTAQVGFRVGD